MKKQTKPHSFFYVLVLVATLGALQAILSPKISETYVESEIAEKPHQEAPVASSEASSSKLEIVAVPIVTPKPSVEMQIRALAHEADFKWPDYLVRLAYCESRLDSMATNTRGNTPSTSYDRGLFQFNSHWQARVSDECAYDIECSTKKAMEMINNGQQHLWACNKIVLAKK